MDEVTINQLMRLAIDEGKKSVSEEGKLSPKVGAVLYRDGEILGSAYRGQKGPGDHAEYTLFEKILDGKDVSGATLFTTLEPCTSRGKHTPCSDWIIKKGIKHVFIGYLDPNPKIYNIGCKKLKDAGIKVEYFPKQLREEIANDNMFFINQYKANPELEGTATFDYSKNNGLFTIGNGEMQFETKWSKGSDQVIHCLNRDYSHSSNIKALAKADGNNEISHIIDGSIYDNSSNYIAIPRNGIVILENTNGYFAAIKIRDIKDNTRPNNDRDELIFEYKILDHKTANFSI